MSIGTSPTRHRPGDPTPPPQLTDEQRREGLTSRPLHDRARRAGLRLEVTGTDHGRPAIANLVDDDGVAALAGVELYKVERWLTARGW